MTLLGFNKVFLIWVSLDILSRGLLMEYDFLRRTALSFYKNAKYLYTQEEYNLAAFNIEQAMQLLLKYFLATKVGEFPKTHSLRRLFRESKNLCTDLWEFYQVNASIIGNIESAYMASRYYPVYFEGIEIKEMLKIFDKFIEVIDGCL